MTSEKISGRRDSGRTKELTQDDLRQWHIGIPPAELTQDYLRQGHIGIPPADFTHDDLRQ